MQTETLSHLPQDPPLLGEPGPLKCVCVCTHGYVYLYTYAHLQVERESPFFLPLSSTVSTRSSWKHIPVSKIHSYLANSTWDLVFLSLNFPILKTLTS